MELRILSIVSLVQPLAVCKFNFPIKDTEWQRRIRFNGIRSIRVVKLFRAIPDINVRIKFDLGCRLNLIMLLYFNITWSTTPDYKFMNGSIIQLFIQLIIRRVEI